MKDINLTKHVQDLHAENYKMLMKETKYLNRHNMFIDWKAQNSRDVNSLHIDTQV